MTRTLPLAAGAAFALSASGAFAQNAGVGDRRDGVTVAPVAMAHGDHAPKSLRLRACTVDTSGACDPLSMAVRDDSASRRHIIQLDGPMNPQRRERLRAAGLSVIEFVTDNAFLVDLTHADPDAVDALEFVRWNSKLAAAWKIDPEMGTRVFRSDERKAIADSGRIVAAIALFPGAEAEGVTKAIRGMDNAELTRTDHGSGAPIITAVLTTRQARSLSALDDVQFVGEMPEATLRNSASRWIVQSNIEDVTPLYDNGLRGENQLVAVVDSRVDRLHCSFADGLTPIGPSHRKILAYNSLAGAATHGTHVAGIVVGDAGNDLDTRGVAYNGKLVYSERPSFTEDAFASILNLHHSQGARIHTNSWGMDFRTDYNVWTRDIDLFTRYYEDDIVLFAVSNTSLLYTPENAKNCIAVGATYTAPNQNLVGYGGEGPTADGRRKPDIYAPGRSVVSSLAGSPCGTLSQGGTSMACPAVAGLCMLTRQYFMEGYHPTGAPNPGDEFTPTAALLKAMVINSGQDMTGVAGYPSDREGWGRVLMDDTLYFPGDQRTLVVHDRRHNDGDGNPVLGLSTDEFDSYYIEVTGATEQLRVTMVFTDEAASLNASPAAIRVNDLDLTLVSPTGAHYKGNVFSGGESTTGGDPDMINTVEQVHISAPELGEWEVRVKATAVNAGTQGYALAITGEVTELDELSCPWDLSGDGVVDALDMAVLLSFWSEPYAAIDIASLLSYWGPCP